MRLVHCALPFHLNPNNFPYIQYHSSDLGLSRYIFNDHASNLLKYIHHIGKKTTSGIFISFSRVARHGTQSVTGQYPPGHVPPGHLPQGAYPPVTYQLDTYPPDTYPLGHIPPGHLPPGHLPPGHLPPRT